MKRLFLMLLLSATFLAFNSTAQAQKVKIGTFDSRAVIIAYARSESFAKEMKDFMNEMKNAQDKKDTAKINELNEIGSLKQRILHDQGFGKGSVNQITDKIKDNIDQIIKIKGLSAVVSKWELISPSSNIELVDITMDMLDIFKADENVKKMAKEMMNVKPIENAFFIND